MDSAAEEIAASQAYRICMPSFGPGSQLEPTLRRLVKGLLAGSKSVGGNSTRRARYGYSGHSLVQHDEGRSTAGAEGEPKSRTPREVLRFLSWAWHLFLHIVLSGASNRLAYTNRPIL